LKEGKVATLFRQTGFTDSTWIHLEDEDGKAFTIIISPLMGKTEISAGRVEADVKVYQ